MMGELVEVSLVPVAVPKIVSILDDWLSGEITKLVDAYATASAGKPYSEQGTAKSILEDELKGLLMSSIPLALFQLKSQLPKPVPDETDKPVA